MSFKYAGTAYAQNKDSNLVLTPNQRAISSTVVKSTQYTNMKQLSTSTPQISLNSNIVFKSIKGIHKSTEEVIETKSAHNHNYNNRSQVNKSKSALNILKGLLPILNKIRVDKQQIINRQRIKGKLKSILNKSHVYNFEMYLKLNKLFHREGYYNHNEDEDEKDDKDKYNSNKSIRKNFSFKYAPDIFSKDRVYHRYEDYFETPEAFLNKHFTEEEIDIMISSPELYGLKLKPFKGSNIKIIENLRDQLNKEEGKSKFNVMKNDNSSSWLYREQSQNIRHKAKKINLTKRPISTISEILKKAMPKSHKETKRIYLFEMPLNTKIVSSSSKVRNANDKRKETMQLINQLKGETNNQLQCNGNDMYDLNQLLSYSKPK